MKFIFLNNKSELNGFLSSQPHSRFLQSWEWGEFQSEIFGKIFRLAAVNGGKMIATATLIKKKLPLGKCYFFCPRGPVILSADSEKRSVELHKLLFAEIAKLAKVEKAIFMRFEPQFPISRFPDFPISKTIDIQPSKTLILDLRKTEDELLADMHQKTRYNIRLAARKGVKIMEIIDLSQSDFDAFWGIMSQTKERDGFRLHSREYYQKMLSIDFIRLYLAEFGGKIIAGNVIAFFGDTVSYLHGASANGPRNVMAPYLLQWHVIEQAKAAGYKYYDFYGIDGNKWPGVTRFKRGFGGEEVIYPGTFDVIYNKASYTAYRLARKIRRTF